jgi:protein-disulfide isomerase
VAAFCLCLLCIDVALAANLVPTATPIPAAVRVGSTAQKAATAAKPIEEVDGMPAGFTDDGYPFLGSPQAPVTLIEHSDYLCPFCGRHFAQTYPQLLDKYIRTGKVQLVFHDFPIASLHPMAPQGHAAARCVAEQGAALFWKMHDELFRTQQQWGSLPNPSDFITDLAKQIGVDTNAFADCTVSGRTVAVVDESIAEGQALDFNGTPSFQFVLKKSSAVHELVGAYPIDEFSRWIDSLIQSGEPPEQPEPENPELPYWANGEGLAPDPERPGFTLAGDPYKGNPQAKVVVVEFSNFQCPSCQQHAVDVQPAIDKALVESDQILWVFKNLPLRSLVQSLPAAAAAECAGEQGQFWAMHDLLFKSQKQWAIDKPDPVLVSLAKEVGLGVDQFSACLSGRQALERVVNDLFDAQGVVSTTPTFIVLSGGRGAMMRGSKPADQFVTLLHSRLAETKDSE